MLKHFYTHVYFKFIIKIGASAVDSNEFLIHLLNRYGLLLWIRSVRYCVLTPMYKTCSQGSYVISRFFGFDVIVLVFYRPEYDVPTGQDDNVRQTIMLAEEFLNLLLIILGNILFVLILIVFKKYI